MLEWAPSYLEVLEGDDLGLDEATLEVRVDHTRRLPQSTHREASDAWWTSCRTGDRSLRDSDNGNDNHRRCVFCAMYCVCALSALCVAAHLWGECALLHGPAAHLLLTRREELHRDPYKHTQTEGQRRPQFALNKNTTQPIYVSFSLASAQSAPTHPPPFHASIHGY